MGNPEPSTDKKRTGADCALLADLFVGVAVLGAPGVTVAVGITEVTSILAALLVGVCDRNSDHLAVHIRKHRMAVRTDGLTAAQQ